MQATCHSSIRPCLAISRTSSDQRVRTLETSPASLTTNSHRANPQCRSHCTDNHARDQYGTQTPHARYNLLARNWNAQYGITYATWVTKPTLCSKVHDTYT